MELKDATILVVDDEMGLLTFFKKWFERENSHVLTAENGEQALDLLKAHRVDMIISDVRMPVMDGVQLVQNLRNLNRPLPKIIFVSGFADIDERNWCDLGIEMTLAKPIRREALVAAVAGCLVGREKLWREPGSVPPERHLEAVYEDLRGAKMQGLIALGHGGMCVRSVLAVRAGQRIGLNLGFITEHHAFVGEGIVRWTDQSEEQIGVEITYINDQNRAWAVDLTQRDERASFIPRSSSMATIPPARRSASSHTSDEHEPQLHLGHI